MSQQFTAIVQLAISGLSLLVAVGAVMVAWLARSVAKESVRVAQLSVETARRQVALVAVPYLVAENHPEVSSSSGRVDRLRVEVANASPVPAQAIHAEATGCPVSRFEPDPETRIQSTSRANMAPGKLESLSMDLPESMRTAGRGGSWAYKWLVVKVIYYGPHGAKVTQGYDWTIGSGAWRFRRNEINPNDGGPIIRVDMSL